MTEHRRRLAMSGKQLKEKHFSDEEWGEFARGKVPKNLRDTMRRHLLDGCRNCQKKSELWHVVAMTAGREASYAPPDHTVRSARGQFGLNRALPWTTGFIKTVRMVFDSFKSPSPLGVRASGAKARQLVYQVGEYLIDVRLEPEHGSRKLNLIGQLRDSLDPGKKMGDSNVILLRGQDRVGQTTTNRFGEFRLEFERKDNLWLAIGIHGEAGIVVPLERVIEPELTEARL
jgi:hypothetical protein